MTTFVVATNSVHTSAALCDYLVGRAGDEDTVHAINSHLDEESATGEELRDGEDALVMLLDVAAWRGSEAEP